jgi:hypothetical protein
MELRPDEIADVGDIAFPISINTLARICDWQRNRVKSPLDHWMRPFQHHGKGHTFNYHHKQHMNESIQQKMDENAPATRMKSRITARRQFKPVLSLG